MRVALQCLAVPCSALQDLEAEIDRLYTAKTSADNEADAAQSSARSG